MGVYLNRDWAIWRQWTGYRRQSPSTKGKIHSINSKRNEQSLPNITTIRKPNYREGWPKRPKPLSETSEVVKDGISHSPRMLCATYKETWWGAYNSVSSVQRAIIPRCYIVHYKERTMAIGLMKRGAFVAFDLKYLPLLPFIRDMYLCCHSFEESRVRRKKTWRHCADGRGRQLAFSISLQCIRWGAMTLNVDCDKCWHAKDFDSTEIIASLRLE